MSIFECTVELTKSEYDNNKNFHVFLEDEQKDNYLNLHSFDTEEDAHHYMNALLASNFFDPNRYCLYVQEVYYDEVFDMCKR
jgi:hypothetical protein